MLRILRKKMRGILIATIAIIIPAFIGFYGVSRYQGKGKPTTVIAKANGQKIYSPQFYNVYRRIKESRRTIYGGRWNEEAEKQIEKEALEQLIKEILLRQEAKRRRIRVSDEEVLKEIRSNPYFQKEGKFDRNLYLQILDINRIDLKQFEEGVRSDLRIRKLLRQVVEGATISDEELREEYIKRNEKAKVKYLLFKREDFKKEIAVAEREIEEYFQSHREGLKIPNRVNTEYIIISFNPEEMEIKEEEIADYYQEHLERYKKEVPEEAPLKEPSPIPLEEVRTEIRDTLANQKAEERAREEAEDLAYDLVDRTAWETIVRERGLEVKETGFFARGEAIKDLGWAPDFVEKAFSLEEDDISGAIKTPKGYAIFIVKEISEAHLPQLEEVKDKVEEKVRDKKAKELARAKAEECLRKLNEGNDFQEVAKEFSLELKDSKFFSQGEYIDGIGFSSPFAEATFSLQEGEISPVVEVSLGFAILKVEERKEIDEEKFALEAEEFRKNLLSWKKMEIYNQWYQALRKEANIWIDPDFMKKLGWTTEGIKSAGEEERL